MDTNITADRMIKDKRGQRWFQNTNDPKSRVYLEDKSNRAAITVAYNGEQVICWESNSYNFAESTGVTK